MSNLYEDTTEYQSVELRAATIDEQELESNGPKNREYVVHKTNTSSIIHVSWLKPWRRAC